MDLKYMGLNFRQKYPCKGGNNYNKYSSNNICYIDCSAGICYRAELMEIHIDMNSAKNRNIARFSIKSPDTKHCPKLICVKYRALVTNRISIAHGCHHFELPTNGEFEFDIPNYTFSLEVVAKVFFKKEGDKHNKHGQDICIKSYNMGGCNTVCNTDCNTGCNTDCNTDCKAVCTKVVGYYPSSSESIFNLENIPLRLALIQCDYNTNEASALDATPVAPNENRVANQQAGPLRASRAMAMVYIAMFEALNSVIGSYTSYTNLSRAINGTSAEAAVFQATHDTLVHLYPSQQPIFDSQLSTQLAQIPTGPGKILGVQKGSESAQLIIAMRTNDGSQIPEPIIIQGINPSPTVDTINNIYYAGTAPGMWRNDPITPKPIALGARWSEVTPLSIPSANSFRCGPPPDLTSVEYAMAFNEVKSVGGNGTTTATVRSQEATNIGIYWAYDGVPKIGYPCRMYNQIVTQICNDEGFNNLEFCRALALSNIAMMDSGIAGWEAKYFYNVWRPISAIRESDVGTGISGLGDSNADTIGDINWTSYGAPLSNKIGLQSNPPFPAYVSGHAIFCAASLEILVKMLGTDNYVFTFVSDELNGVTTDNQGNVRPLLPRTFTSFSQAMEECGQSRMYLGIHFNTDKVYGVDMGRQVANHIFSNIYV